MKVVFLSNYFNVHQASFADEMDALTNHNFYFIETAEVPEFRLKLGYKNMQRDYVLQTDGSLQDAVISKLIDDADVVILGLAPYSMVKKRIEDGKLVFRYSERIFKSVINKVLVPRASLKYRLEGGLKDNMYLLCASAYAQKDYESLGCYVDRCYRWGYFPSTPVFDSVEDVIANKEKNSIIWVGRLIPWKHPEHAILVANGLKEKGYEFHLKMIGIGPLEQKLRKLIIGYGLEEYVSLMGPLPFEQVQQEMRQSQIALLTSDYHEGWGAVVNETMGNACAVVASTAMGAVPFLVEDGLNGYQYTWNDVKALEAKVEELVNDSRKRERFARNAYKTMQEKWNCKVAAKNLIELSSALLKEKTESIVSDGPCSKI